MNQVEAALVNSPIWGAAQRYFIAPQLRRWAGHLPAGKALEIGCGVGRGVEIILDVFDADEVKAIDLDPRQVSRARRRLADRGDRVAVSIGDATSVPAVDDSFDSVFDFAIVHHVPDWRAAVAEVARVLKPGGTFYFLEVTHHALDRPTFRWLFDHPRDDRFSAREFVDEVTSAGMVTEGRWSERVLGDYVLGVATRWPTRDPDLPARDVP